jgi:hypothetical protein
MSAARERWTPVRRKKGRDLVNDVPGKAGLSSATPVRLKQVFHPPVVCFSELLPQVASVVAFAA